MRPNWFIAFSFSEKRWFEEKVHSPPGGIRLFHPEDLHLTIAFLGGVSETQARQAWDIAHNCPSGELEVSLGEVRGMGNPQRVSAYAVTLEKGRAQVAERMNALREEMWEAAGARRDTRPATPHITFARPPRRAKQSLRDDGLAWAKKLQLRGTTLAMEEIALYTWSIDRKSRLFAKVSSLSL